MWTDESCDMGDVEIVMVITWNMENGWKMTKIGILWYHNYKNNDQLQ